MENSKHSLLFYNSEFDITVQVSYDETEKIMEMENSRNFVRLYGDDHITKIKSEEIFINYETIKKLIKGMK